MLVQEGISTKELGHYSVEQPAATWLVIKQEAQDGDL
jgi:hypothetical protein